MWREPHRRARRMALVVMTVLGAWGLAAACAPNPGDGTTNAAPVAQAAANPGTTSMEVAFSSAGSHDPDGSIAAYSWNFGDGSAPSSDPNPSHTYLNVGTFTATLTVTDLKGATGTASVAVTVPVTPNQPPVAFAIATPDQGPAPLVVSFDSSGSHDPEGGPIASYRWQFGDGVESTDANPTHTFATLGDFDVVLTVTDASGAEGSFTVPVSTWKAQLSNPAQGRCVDLANGGTGNGTAIGSYPCTGNTNQQWVLGPNGRISISTNANKCMDALNGGALGAEVGIWDCNGGLNQRWIRSGDQLVNDANDLCLTSKDGKVQPGTRMVLATCNPADSAQKWVVAKSQSAEYLRVRNPGTDRCVGTSGNGLSNGRAIADWACTNDSAMAWYLDPNGMMINRAGPSWCADGSGGTAGKAVVIWECGDSQTWQRWHTNADDQLVNNTNNLCMTRSTANGDLPGATMSLAACDTANPNQKFVFEPAGQWAWQQLRNPVTGNCAVVTNTNNGTKVQTETCDPADAGQSWYLDAGGRLFHRWVQGNNGRCADGNNGGNAGNEVIIYDCNTQPWQDWTVVGDTLVNSAHGLCVEAVGTGLKLAACNGSDAQRWIVETR